MFDGAFVKTSGSYAIIVSQSDEDNNTKLKLPYGAKKTVSGSARAILGIVAGGGRIDKPVLKAGNRTSFFSLLHIFQSFLGLVFPSKDNFSTLLSNKTFFFLLSILKGLPLIGLVILFQSL